ncbi:MAG: ABC transporter ATP-binding protein [Paracoccaceae bacterium]
MTAVGINGLTVGFDTAQGRVRPVRDLSLTIGAGRIMGLVGESGSGKSTVALALPGLLATNARVESGTLTLGADRHDLTRPDSLAPLRGRRIAMVFQDPFSSLNPVFTIGTHLAEALTRREPGLDRASARARMTQALETVGVPDPAQRLAQYPFQLSGGLRQRVCIAMALLARPDLLIADEPTTALDATVEAQVMAELCALRDRIGCSILLITHSLGLVVTWCDDIAVMYAGDLVETGPADAVTARPLHPYSAALLGCEIALDRPIGPGAPRFAVIPGELPDPLHLPTGCPYAPRCPLVIDRCLREMPAVRGTLRQVRCHVADVP